MAILLSILALVIASAACVAAWRAHRGAHRLAREMVQLRDRLAQAEAGRAAAEARVDASPVAAPADAHVAERLDAVEARLRAAMEREAAGAGDGVQDARDEISRHLRSQGYQRIVFLDTDGEGSVLVEAERHGSTAKARASVDAEGRVRLTSVNSVRAFP